MEGDAEHTTPVVGIDAGIADRLDAIDQKLGTLAEMPLKLSEVLEAVERIFKKGRGKDDGLFDEDDQAPRTGSKGMRPSAGEIAPPLIGKRASAGEIAMAAASSQVDHLFDPPKEQTAVEKDFGKTASKVSNFESKFSKEEDRTKVTPRRSRDSNESRIAAAVGPRIAPGPRRSVVGFRRAETIAGSRALNQVAEIKEAWRGSTLRGNGVGRKSSILASPNAATVLRQNLSPVEDPVTPVFPCVKVTAEEQDSDEESNNSQEWSGTSRDTDDTAGIMSLSDCSFCAKGERTEGTQSIARAELFRKEESKPCILLPDSLMRVSWDCLMALTVLYTCVVVPLGIAHFSQADVEGMAFGAPFIFVDTCWIIDVLINFRTGLNHAQEDDCLILAPRKIALHYARTWLVLDVLTSWPPVLSPQGHVARKVILAVKLLRALRLRAMYSRMQKYLRSRSLQPIKWSVGLFLLSHVMACSWRLAQWSSGMEEGPEYWDIYSQDGLTYWHHYVQDTYWILMTMTTVGYGDIYPRNTPTRMYAIGIMLIAPVFFGLVVSGLTHVMSTVFDDKVESRLAEVVRFMRRRGVPQDVQYRVERSLRRRLTQNQQAVMDPELFELLSPGLQNELSLSLLGRAVLRFPLFSGALHSFIAELAQAHTWVQCSRGDLVAEVGQLIQEMVFVVQGQLLAEFGAGSEGKYFDVDVKEVSKAQSITLESAEQSDLPPGSVSLGVGAWFGEACLFQKSHVRTASFIAAIMSDLAVLPASEYLRVVSKYPLLLQRHTHLQRDIHAGKLHLSALSYMQVAESTNGLKGGSNHTHLSFSGEAVAQ